MSLIRRLGAHVDRMPRAPYVIAVVLASLLAVVAWTTAPEIDTDVDEVTYPSATGFPDASGEETAEVELVEYGFGSLTLNGVEYLSVGAVVRNPHPELSADVTFEATAIDAEGNTVVTELLGIRHAAPNADTLFGRLISMESDRWDEYEVELSLVEAELWSERMRARPHLEDRFAVLEIQDMLVPEGKRIVYQVESDLDGPYSFQPEVVFRDASGRIVGGVAGRDRPATDADSNARVTVQPGISVRHFHLKPDEIPAGADLERTEIGPGGILAGG